MEVGIVRSRYGCRQAACATSALIAAAEAAGNCEEQTLRLQQPPTDQSGARPAGTLTLAHTISAPHAILPDRHAQHGRPAFLQVPTYICERYEKAALSAQHRHLKKVGTLQEGQAIKPST